MTVHAALTEGEFSLENSLKLAARLALKLDTTLVGVSAMPDPARAMLMTGVSMHGVMIATGGTLADGIRDAQKEAREKLETLFHKVCNDEGVPVEKRKIEHEVGLPSEVYPRISMLSDAFVTPHECVTDGSDHGLAFESILLDKRLPVIACGTDEPANYGTVIIAWDGSPEAARAVRFHTPVLKAADRIIIAQNSNRIDAQDRNGSEDPAFVQAYLERFGIASEATNFNGNVAEGLLKLASDESAGIIIAGAYGHNRLEEFIFGGVSKSLLRADQGPALALAH